jgi:hypothetical protein
MKFVLSVALALSVHFILFSSNVLSQTAPFNGTCPNITNQTEYMDVPNTFVSMLLFCPFSLKNNIVNL